ncbi:TetR/AcrR family transcriptional regulator [Acinetobacter pollinis]|uniref:TetR/AcrR family transcriptional regulator n=1 Tax=Acinetobacter pollinis TaxID=2605270 RepID=UPI0018A25F3B|nr:TetR/AcrR family transcriptional regulator [Acinetobacter pollinis]MBF7690393.1 TetR/AcrR family transcriptional regulator [Acinetobacter pollinis]MBF7697942.1 TetR/AcrR family transcriptional regulator [Acinetobacter pollinis]
MSKKQKDILYKAIELFNQFGYASVGIDRIISESKVAKMTFYKYFPSKDNLITECLLERDRLIRESIQSSLEENQDSYFKLKTIFDWFEKWFYQEDFHGCMFIKALDELPHHPDSQTISKAHKQWLTDTIEQLLQEMNVVDNHKLAIQIRLLLDGAIIHEQLFKDYQAITFAWDVVAAMLSHATIS